MTKLSSRLPKGEGNGLESINRPLVDKPGASYVVVAVVDCQRITTEMDTGDHVATARIRRIEPIAPDDTDHAVQLLRRAQEHRTGAAVLPLELEDELTDLIAKVDTTTGELPQEDDQA